MITIDTTKLYYILEHTPATHNIMLVGRHGIGKSEILSDYYKKKGLQVVSLFLGQMADPGDLIGLPTLEETPKSNTNQKVTTYAPPFWFPKDDRPIILFLDELNRARPEILQTVMDLALNRRLVGKSLPDGSRIISAVNEGDEYQLTHLDPALVSRFNIYKFCPTVAEWLLWAQKDKLDQRVIDFISNEPTYLDGTPEVKEGDDTGLEKYPDRRAWKRVSDILHFCSHDSFSTMSNEITDNDLNLIAGIIGAEAASRFYAFTQGSQMITGGQVLTDFDSCESRLRSYRLHQIAIVNESIFRHFDVEGFDKTTDSTDELRMQQISLYRENLLKYYNLLEMTEQREAIAHFANLFESGSYQGAILFIITYSPEIYQKLEDFIASM